MIAYQEKLRDPRWQKKRLGIFERDGWQCTFCKETKNPLVVHHLCYFPHTEPWDHDEHFMTTLCESCHETNATEEPSIKTHLLLVASLKRRKDELENLIRDEFDRELSLRLDMIISLLDRC